MIVEFPTLLAFSVAALATVVSPGPDTILILRHALSSGRKAGVATVIGIQCGLVGHTLLAIFGISVIIASSPILFKTVAVLGASYLAWIGFQGFRGTTLKFKGDAKAVKPIKAFLDGMICNLLNPKVIILFLALLPNFLSVENGHIPLQLITLSGVLILFNAIWQIPIAMAAHGLRKVLNIPKVQIGVNIFTGVILCGFAFFMLWEHLL